MTELFSDIPNDRVLRWDETSGVSSVFAAPAGANGRTIDRQGRVITCEHGGRRVTRLEHDGVTTVLGETRARQIRRFDVTTGGAVTGGTVFADAGESIYDGVRLDEEERLWVAADDGLHCFGSDGTLLGKVILPEAASNLTFGGPKRNVLFVTATWAVYAIRLNVCGVRYPR